MFKEKYLPEIDFQDIKNRKKGNNLKLDINLYYCATNKKV
jgi:hypothetical protein